MRPIVVPLCFLLLAFDAARAELVKLKPDNIEIDAGSIGHFSLKYPELQDAKGKSSHKLLDRKIEGATASLNYEGGTKIDVTVVTGGRVTFKLSGTQTDLKGFIVNMQIPIAFNQAGKWKAGTKEGEFPQEKPPKPHLLQATGDSFQITNYEGKTLAFKLPEFSFLELTDNREWNWSIYHFRAITPFNPDRKEYTVTISTTASAEKAEPIVDQFGQSARGTWPGKVQSIEELKADVEAEKNETAAVHLPTLDRFGGLPGSKEKYGLKATGFFHVEKQGDRDLLVDPDGNAFFHLGVCSVGPIEDFTVVKGREGAYAWLPPKTGEFATAWKADNNTVFSFHLANMIRKYGEPYSNESYTARMITRLKSWGFNSIGAFSSASGDARNAANFPTVSFLPLNEFNGGISKIPNIGETFDPFDEKIRARLEENFAKSLPPKAADPLIIGYFIVNEPIYENIPHIVPTLKGNHACKQKFVQWLTAKYQDIAAFNTAWQLKAGSFEELADTVLAVKPEAAKADVQEFTGVFLEEYFKLISEAFRKHDPNHLLLGCRLQPGTIQSEQLCRIAGKYIDVMSFNYYTDGVNIGMLKKIYEWTGKKPFMLSEFYWSASKESNLSGGREVPTQKDRGLAYRNYVEQGAATGMVIGIEWFTLVDQAFTGRWFQGLNGERANCGIISVTDRPWKPLVEEMSTANYDIYKVEFGERPPFEYDNPKFKNTK